MRTRITICLAILLQSFSVGFIPAQSTFDFVLEYPVRKYSPVAIERDNGEIVDWDTDVNTSTETTSNIADDSGTALTSDDGTNYSVEDNSIDKGV